MSLCLIFVNKMREPDMTDFFKQYKEFADFLEQHPVVLVGLGAKDDITCPQCADSAAALAQCGVAFSYMDAHNNPALVDCIAKKAPIASLPYLFVHAKPFGGYEEIRQGLATGELQDMV